MISGAHPGTVVFVDGSTGEVTQEKRAEDVPESIRFATLDGRLIPVVRVVAFSEPDRRILREYGPDGQLLRSSVYLTGRSEP